MNFVLSRQIPRKDTVFLSNHSYKRNMTKFSNVFSRYILAMAGKSPWGSDGSGGNKRGSGSGGDDSNGGPRNPWQPGGQPAGGRKSSNIEDLFKKGRNMGGGGSGGGFTGLPRRPNGKSYVPIIIAVVIVLWLVMTSFHRIALEEEGVVTQLGAYNRTVQSGLQLTLPAPFERMQKVNVQEIRTVPIGSTETSSENLVLTSDQNIIDMAYEVRWSISDPERYLFQIQDPEETIREVAESAMRAAVANFELISAIGPGRSDIEAQVRSRMQELLNQYNSGITVQGVAIKQSDPPEEVNDAFRAVNAAQQKRESYINNARAYAQQILERAEGDTAAFDKVFEQYRLAPEVTRRRMYYDTMENVLGKVDKTIVEPGGVQTYLPLPEVRQRSRPAAQPQAATGGE